MKAFAALIQILGASAKTNEKLDALSQYFLQASDADKVWVIAIFSGRRPKRMANSRELKDWCMELTALPEWLFEEAYHTVGDLAETIALLLPEAQTANNNKSLTDCILEMRQLEKADEPLRKAYILEQWMRMDSNERFLFNKLITGGFRIGVSQQMMVQALAKATQLAPEQIALLISGNWNPTDTSFQQLMDVSASRDNHSRPYPFYLAYALDTAPEALGQPHEWQAEWKWDGIRGQIICRNEEIFVWSRGEELMTERFPELQHLTHHLPAGTVLDGEIVTMQADKLLPFATLQTRISRKQITKKILQEAPVAFLAYDLLEYGGNDRREWPLEKRRLLLENIVAQATAPLLKISPTIDFKDWEELTSIRKSSRTMQAEGLMLKRRSSVYQSGRKTGDWWKWKIDPMTIDAVLLYAQKGHGRRSNLFTDYTFAVKDGDKLVTFTKAYSGLTDKEFAEVDAFVKQHAIEKFGPVRTVKPELVFEIAFEGIAASNRHKSGVALRFPRMHRWRRDKKADEINTLDDLKQLLHLYGQ